MSQTLISQIHNISIFTLYKLSLPPFHYFHFPHTPFLFSTLTTTTKTATLPPGPLHIPILTSLLWLRKSFSQLEPFLKTLHAKHGPIIALRIGSRPSIFIADCSLAHHSLVHNSSIFSDRPKALPTGKLMSSNQHNISSTSYGATWRTLRRNLASEMLHPAKVKSFSEIQNWVLDTLINRLKMASESESFMAIPHFHYAMFCLLVFMCFGERVSDEKVNEIERVQRTLLLSMRRFNILNFWPQVTKILLRKRWEELLKLHKGQEDVLLPLIRARKQNKGSKSVVSYADTLLELELKEENHKLNEDEMVSLCSEFLNGGTDTTSTALQWIIANLVKYPDVQRKLVEEIREVIGGDDNGLTKIVAPGGETLGGVIGAFQHMIRTEGIFSLYKGLVPSLISIAPSSAVFYGVYDMLKSSYLHSPEGMQRTQNLHKQGQELSAFDQLELGPVRTLLYGDIAGACAEAAT
ncbi:unnamed protein product [Vicia faba]|uniref:Cytochrome P450 n=1 Tax=Vicia faba TaxID=3906 RepID=A0AAV0Z9J6_VICFA|nr:unnamed protein product [Vicia faba]